jgi:alpha-tubulin suppressor-like RCC1 family protein
MNHFLKEDFVEINCTINDTDVGDLLNLSWEMKINNILNSSGTINNSIGGTYSLSNFTNLNDLDNITFTCNASDGRNISSSVVSKLVSIRPTFDLIFNYNNTWISNNVTIISIMNLSNASEDIKYGRYSWSKNGVIFLENTFFKYGQIATGEFHSCGIRANDSRVLCWGQNTYGQLGDSSNTQRNIPTLINDTSAYSQISAFYRYSCGIRANDSRVLCWGANGNGQLGDNTTTQRNFPALINDSSSYSLVSAGYYHSCGIRLNDSRVLCWGSNANGKLGDGFTTQRLVPTLINDSSSYSLVSAGYDHSCGIRANDSLVLCWGYNQYGRLGDGSTTTRYNPTLINDSSSYSLVSAGNQHSCGVHLNDSRVLCWGYNTNGRIGDNSTTHRYNPTLINDSSSYSLVSAGYDHSCGIRLNDSRVLCWGSNGNGQLGDNTTTQRNLPTLINDFNEYSQIAAGYSFSCGLRSSDSLVLCWGYNSNAQLGDNSTTQRLIPTLTNDTSGYSGSIAKDKIFYSNNLSTSITTSGLDNITFSTYFIDIFNIASETKNISIQFLAPPTVNNYYFIPNDSTRIDPGTLIYAQINLTHVIPIINVTFEYLIDGNWTESNVTNISTNVYSSQFITKPLNNSIAEFRFKLTDSYGAVNYVGSNAESYWDCEWNVTELDIVTGWDGLTSIANLNLTNFGDSSYSGGCNLIFRVLHNMTQGRILFDNFELNPSLNYPLAPNQSSLINIKYNFYTTQIQEVLNLTIQELNRVSSRNSSSDSVLVFTLKDGPYLYSEVSSDISQIYLTNGSFNVDTLFTNVKGSDTINITNTAYDVIASWSIPAELSVTSGNLTNYYENITDNNYRTQPLEISLSDLNAMTPGIKNFTFRLQGFNSSGSPMVNINNETIFEKSLSINFLCYALPDGVCVSACGYTQDPDCTETVQTETIISSSTRSVAPTSSTTKSLTEEESKKVFQTKESYEIIRGKGDTFIIIVQNPFNGTLTDLKLKSSGFLSQYFKITSDSKNSLEVGKSKNFIVEITAPTYFTQGSYELKFDITAQLIEKQQSTFGSYYTKNTSIYEQRFITLKILEISQADANILVQEINETINAIKELRGDDFDSKLIISVEQSLKEKDFNTIIEVNKQIITDYENLNSAVTLLNSLNEKTKTAKFNGLKTSETDRLILLANAALEREDYELAQQRATDATLTYSVEVYGKFNLLYFIKNNYLEIIIISILVFIVSYILWLRIRLTYLNNLLRTNKQEELVVVGLMKEAQVECFEHKKTSIKDYEDTMLNYEKRLSQLVNTSLTLESKKKNLLKLFSYKKQQLFTEREDIISGMESAQKNHFTSSTIGSRLYTERMQSYVERLAEIEENIATMQVNLEMKKALREKLWGLRS